jgi:CPA2 family monovalent cation:H+ antiporter-2
LVVGLLVVPRLLHYVAKFKSNEMLLVTVLGIVFGFCLLVMKMQYSVALGAFLIGAIMAEAREIHLIERLTESLKDMFSAIFFVAIGLMFDPSVLAEYWLPIIVITGAIVIGQLISCGLGVFLCGHDGRTSLRVGMGLSQIGEFSFIIAALGVSLKVTSEFLYPLVVSVSAVTTLLTPYLIRAADPLSARLVEKAPKKLSRLFAMYSHWLQSMQPQGDKAALRAMINRIVMQVAINVAVVIAIFMVLAFFDRPLIALIAPWVADLQHDKAIIWGVALLLSIPFLIATYRKLQVLSMLLAEVSVKPEFAGAYTMRVRRVISELIPISALVMLMLMIFLLSANILPPLNLLVVVCIAACVVSWLMWSKFVKLHSRLQIALMETLQDAPRDKH